jgi:N-acetyl-anhydromuramyl-L-alanine amidase AmpD
MNFKPSMQRLTAPTVSALAVALIFTGCATRPGTLSKRKGDEIIVAGQLFHTGTRVVTWMDPGGYDAYRLEKRFSKPTDSKSSASTKSTASAKSSASGSDRIGFGLRKSRLTDAEIERLHGGGWDLPTLQRTVDQFVIHFDVAGVSKNCFKVLHDVRGLAVQFMLDLDGTIYQTLDAKEGAWQATIANDRSVGIEIANIGAYGEKQQDQLKSWYKKNKDGRTTCIFPAWVGTNTQYTKDFVGHPARREAVAGPVQGKKLYQYDYTPQQYEALAKLTATLCTVFPKLKCDYPRDAAGKLITHKLPDAELKKYQGVLGHYHVQTNKTDPGPAFQWDYVINNAQQLMKTAPGKATDQKSLKMLRDN